MATKVKVHIDAGAIAAQVLKSPGTAAEIDRLAASYAEALRALVGDDIPVDVRPYTSDRRAAGVAIAHPAGLAIQAKHGVMTRAASAIGATVSSR